MPDRFQVSCIICFAVLMSGLFLIKRFPQMLFPTMYILQLSVLGTGIGLSVLQPDLRVATVIATATIIPTFYIDRTAAFVAVEGIAVLAYVLLGKRFIDPDVFSWGLETLLLFSVAGILNGHFINKARFERYVYAESEKKLAEMQQHYNEELQKEVAAKTRRIEELHEQFVLGMATMVEGRDNSTGGHIRRTSEGVRILTEAIRRDSSVQLPEGFCEMIVKAAPMHDLGKIAVDDSILRKPGRFTPEEFEIMKKHAPEGARIVREILKNTDDEEFKVIAENVAHYHHERWDGSGYPDKLKGEEIPLEARIMAIADVWDALVSKRVYKDKMPFEKADAIMTEGMGSQFDPSLERIYRAALPHLEAYYQSLDAQEA